MAPTTCAVVQFQLVDGSTCRPARTKISALVQNDLLPSSIAVTVCSSLLRNFFPWIWKFLVMRDLALLSLCKAGPPGLLATSLPASGRH